MRASCGSRGREAISSSRSIGTNDTTTVQGWYDAPNNQVAKIKDGSGDYVNANNVEALRSATSSFSPPPLGQTALDPAVAQSLAPTLAASWHAA